MSSPDQAKKSKSKKSKKAEKAEKVEEPEELDIVIICNPQAGGRWKNLADILDSDEARHVRRIVTDRIGDIGPALADLGQKTQLLCIYGGDGTIQRILDKLFTELQEEQPQLAFIGGGTMNVASRWCGLSSKPGRNFRDIIKAYKSDQLLLKEVPLLEVRQGEELHYGFTFGMGPLVRILDAYENGSKGIPAAMAIAGKSIASTFTGKPEDFQPVLAEMPAEIFLDEERLPYHTWAGAFCNVTGKVHIGVEPFPKPRERETFFTMNYAISRRELALLLPMLVRGHRPIDAKALLQPVTAWKRLAMAYLGKDSFPLDPRYINTTAQRFEIRTTEPIYTVDGEILQSTGEPIYVGLGPTIRVAVSSTVGLGGATSLVAGVARMADLGG